MKKRKKFKMGPVISSLIDFQKWTDNGGWIYWHGKPKHPTILQNQQYRVILGLLKTKSLNKAIYIGDDWMLKHNEPIEKIQEVIRTDS